MRKGIFLWIVLAVLALPAYFVLHATREVFFPLPSDSCGYDIEHSRTITCGEAWATRKHAQIYTPEQNNWAPDAPKKDAVAVHHHYEPVYY